MNNAKTKYEHRFEWGGTQRVPIVFVSSSAKDAHSLREFLDGNRWLLVNVPDLSAAQSVIEKLSPGLIVCDTEIEGEGSWRDLLARHSPSFGPPFFVSSQEANEALCSEVLARGGSGVVKRPFSTANVPVIRFGSPS